MALPLIFPIHKSKSSDEEEGERSKVEGLKPIGKAGRAFRFGIQTTRLDADPTSCMDLEANLTMSIL